MQSPSPSGGGGVEPGTGLAISEVTIAEQIAEIDRELAVRVKVYDRWVKQGKLTQAAADLQTKRMTAARWTLRRAHVELIGREPGALHTGEVYGPAKTRADERARILSALAPMVHSDVYLRLVAKLEKQDVPTS